MRRCRSKLEVATRKLPSYDWCRSKLNPGIACGHHLMIDRGKGSYVFDAEGRKYLDFSCGIGVTGLGHCHPRLVKVVREQTEKLWHAQVAFGVHTAMARLLQQLESSFPKELSNFTFVTTGAEAVEAALKAARQATGRPITYAMRGGFHGRTVATLSLTSSKFGYSRGLHPLMGHVHFAPFPYYSQLKVNQNTSVAKMVDNCLAQLEDMMHQAHHPSEVNMIIAEPVLGEGGYVPMPAPFARGLRNLCDKYGILLCWDEIQSGCGRTGSFMTFQQFGVLPDICTFAKGIASGLPIAGVAMTNAVAEKLIPGTQGGTYAGNAVACAAAAECIDILHDENIFENVVERGKQLLEGIKEIVQRNGLPIAEVRGRGLMVSFQFDHIVPSGITTRVVSACAEQGLILMSASLYEVIRIIPPLNVSKEEVTEALTKMEKALIKACAEFPKTEVECFTPCCESPCYSSAANTCCRYIAQRPRTAEKT